MAETLELRVIDVAFGGAGVARPDGKVFFVPFSAPGDLVRVKPSRNRRNFCEAKIIEVVEPSPDRVQPPCAYFTRCGGCAYQHIAYARQLELKHRQVEQTLRRVGKLIEVPMAPIVPSPLQYGYRNRIRVHLESGQAGFFAHRSHELVPIARCEIAQPAVNEALHDLRRSAARDGDYTLVAGDRGDFFEQTNDGVAAELLALVEKSVTRGQQLLVDAYAGAGFFAHHLAPLFSEVVGIEENEYAVSHARKQAAVNERYIVGDVSEVLAEILSVHDMARTTVILDPPATGLTPRALDQLVAAMPSEILYVSCNPATLARDLANLCSRYRLTSVTPLDMFPQTAEIEVLALLLPIPAGRDAAMA
jgi:tRNA/tmRNA/rRNA uracil-C5-methylase (TrmA/RlmC/RlmD family)